MEEKREDFKIMALQKEQIRDSATMKSTKICYSSIDKLSHDICSDFEVQLKLSFVRVDKRFLFPRRY